MAGMVHRSIHAYVCGPGYFTQGGELAPPAKGIPQAAASQSRTHGWPPLAYVPSGGLVEKPPGGKPGLPYGRPGCFSLKSKSLRLHISKTLRRCDEESHSSEIRMFESVFTHAGRPPPHGADDRPFHAPGLTGCSEMAAPFFYWEFLKCEGVHWP